MTKEEMQKELRTLVFMRYGNQKSAAEAWGCHETQVSNAVCGRISPTKKMLEEMGIEKVKAPVTYRRKKKVAA